MGRAVYAGTFDPATKGHLWVIREGARIFDELIVAIGLNPEKRVLLSVPERVAILRTMTKGIANVSIVSFPYRYLVDFADSVGATHILRGIRNSSDFEYERTMRHINADIKQKVGSVFLLPPREIAEVSSSMVKSLIGPEGWEKVVSRYVTKPTLNKLKEKERAREQR